MVGLGGVVDAEACNGDADNDAPMQLFGGATTFARQLIHATSRRRTVVPARG